MGADTVTAVPGKVLIAEQTIGRTVADIESALDKAMQNHEEGIMIKNLSSQYLPGVTHTYTR